MQRLARHGIAQRLAFLCRPVLHQIPCGIERGLVVEQAHEQRRQRAEPAPGAGIAAAHFEIFLEAHLGEDGGEMVRPVLHHGALARQLRQLARHELAEAFAGGVDEPAVANDEVHRHVERIVDIALETEALLEGEGQHAGAGLVGVAPHLRAEGEISVRLALQEGRVGEQRRRHRLQRQRHAQLLHHVGFRGEIEIDLHRAGPEHHVAAIAAHLVHVGRHDAVAALGHDRRFGPCPDRRGAEAEESDAQPVAHLAHLGQVLVNLFAGLVHGAERRAREFELPARLQRDVAQALGIGERDDVGALVDALPAEAVAQALEQRPDRAFAVIGNGPQRVGQEGELLVLRPDAPGRARLVAVLEIGHELGLAVDRHAGQRSIGRRTTQGKLPGCFGRTDVGGRIGTGKTKICGASITIRDVRRRDCPSRPAWPAPRSGPRRRRYRPA